MKMIRILLMAGIVACFTFVGIGGAGAAGGGGKSPCSNFGNPATGTNVGEDFSLLAQTTGFSGELNPGPAISGDPLAAALCNPELP
jgi:hypothetical protein